ncbi:MAG: 50S ribosomal protein L5 [bacterium]
MTNIRKKYQETVVPAIKKNFNLSNDLEVPRLQKVVVNSGVGKALNNSKFIEMVTSGLERITGQHPIIRKAKKSVSGFKIRQGMTVGLQVTLRGSRMEEFIDRLVNITLPRVRDFRGLDPASFGQSGNYTMGIKEHTVFPETQSDDLDKAFGMEITVVTSTKNAEQGLALLKGLGFPFQQ